MTYFDEKKVEEMTYFTEENIEEMTYFDEKKVEEMHSRRYNSPEPERQSSIWFRMAAITTLKRAP